MHLAVDWEHLKIVAAYDDKIIKIYDLKAGQEGYVLGSITLNSPASALAFNGRYIIAAADGEVSQYLAWGGDAIRTYSEQKGKVVTTIAIDKTFFASGDDAGTVHVHKLYNDDANEFNTKIEVEGGKPVTNILFHPDGLSC